MAYCETCKEWKFGSGHVCPPAWLVYRDGYEEAEDASVVYAKDAEGAAEKYIEANFSKWDYPAFEVIYAKDQFNGDWIKCEVVVEAVPNFIAMRLA